LRDSVTILEVGAEEAGLRVDAFVAARAPGLSRSQVEKLAREGRVLVGGEPARPGRRLEPGERVEVSVPAPEPRPLVAEPIPLDILFEDDHVLVVNKPQGMVMHPGLGHRRGTLVNALLAHAPGLAGVGQPHRPGIVHRLDRDTSGLTLVAKTEASYVELAQQVRARVSDRRYLALVWGRVPEDRLIIDVPVGRHREHPKRMAAVPQADPAGKVRAAVTDVRVLDRFASITLVEARLGTGRTHQIRVHMSHQGHPVVGDPVYGLKRAKQELAALDAETLRLVAALPGQALHAYQLSFQHPVTGQVTSFTVPPPREMGQLMAKLRGTAPPPA